MMECGAWPVPDGGCDPSANGILSNPAIQPRPSAQEAAVLSEPGNEHVVG